MRFVRFLKTPRIVDNEGPSQSHMYCLITITSDLGDSFLPYGISLSTELWFQDKVVLRKTAHWGAEMRSLAIKTPINKEQMCWPLRVRVGCGSGPDNFEQLNDPDRGGIVSAWSTFLDPLKNERLTARLVERQIILSNLCPLNIWEETGESIARHMW